MQLGDIDALPIEAEPPAEGRHQEADRDEAPAIVADGGFVDRERAGCVHAGRDSNRQSIAKLRSLPKYRHGHRFDGSITCRGREIRPPPASWRGVWRTMQTTARRAQAIPAETPPC